MARFTIADCMEKIPNRFDLTISAAIRARQIAETNHTLLTNSENDKPTVLALRELAQGLIDESILSLVD